VFRFQRKRLNIILSGAKNLILYRKMRRFAVPNMTCDGLVEFPPFSVQTFRTPHNTREKFEEGIDNYIKT